VIRESCAVIEVNNFYDESARLVFEQQIVWDWCDCEERYQVRDWRLIKSPNQYPVRDRIYGGYVATWQDGEHMRQIRAASMRETWTQYDVEVEERLVLPVDQRRKLRGK
jgi:hypothetical protein